MDSRTLEWFEVLARALLWAAAAVIALSVIGAIAVATSHSDIGGFENVERQGRGVLAIAALGGGITAAGILAGLGAILRLMVAQRRERE